MVKEIHLYHFPTTSLSRAIAPASSLRSYLFAGTNTTFHLVNRNTLMRPGMAIDKNNRKFFCRFLIILFSFRFLFLLILYLFCEFSFFYPFFLFFLLLFFPFYSSASVFLLLTFLKLYVHSVFFFLVKPCLYLCLFYPNFHVPLSLTK
jgi:hypothetical protein